MFCKSFALLSILAAVNAADYKLVWSDEFNESKLNLSNWKYDAGGAGWGNNELEYYTVERDENARVENGHLVIEARPEEYHGSRFTSARLNTRQAWGYGKFEFRARMPSGHHLWPAIWLFPLNQKYGSWAASGEVDIVEVRGDNPKMILGTIHYGGEWPNNAFSGGEKTLDFDMSDDFHVFTLEWSAEKFVWAVDGAVYHEEPLNRMMWSNKGSFNPYTANVQPFDDNPFFIIVNVAVGGQFFGGGPYVTPEEARSWKKRTMEIDYIHVYQRQ